VRIVVDANVLVSGVFWTGPPNRLLDEWAQERVTVCATAPVLIEYLRVITRLATRVGRPDLARRWHAYLFEHLEMVEDVHAYDQCRDPDDNKFVSCALSAAADYLVSGDGDLLVLGSVSEVHVVTPVAFLQMLRHNSTP